MAVIESVIKYLKWNNNFAEYFSEFIGKSICYQALVLYKLCLVFHMEDVAVTPYQHSQHCSKETWKCLSFSHVDTPKPEAIF